MPGVPVSVNLAGARSSRWRSATPATASPAIRPTGPTPGSRCRRPQGLARRLAAARRCRSAAVYDGPAVLLHVRRQAPAELAGSWPARRANRRRTHGAHAALPDEPTGLVVRCVAIEYARLPDRRVDALLQEHGPATRRSCDDIQALDASFPSHGRRRVRAAPRRRQPLHAQRLRAPGDRCSTGQPKRIAAAGGRPTNCDLPYFNLAWPGEGVIAVVGWPGQWAAEFTPERRAGCAFAPARN